MTEYMASSAVVGRRPRMSRIRAYSSDFRPSSLYGCSRSGVRAVDAQRLIAVAEVQVAVAGERARQQAGLAEHLEPVADAQHRHALAGAVDDVGHHRRPRGDGAGPQGVAVGEATGQDDGGDVLQIVVVVPQRD